MNTLEFENRLNHHDLDLFNHIHSESKPGDKVSWLALQRATRMSSQPYVYLEIGSHLGGSIQPHLLDTKCRKIYSIDKRPVEMPDDRGIRLHYEKNSTSRMLANLTEVDSTQVSKIICFDMDAKEIDPKLVSDPPHLCFIDGEHTKSAALSDFKFCLSVCAPEAIISFHDDRIIAPALAEIVQHLRRQGIPYEALKLRGSTFAIVLRRPSMLHGFMADIAVDGHAAIHRMRVRLLAKRIVPSSLRPLASRWFGYKD
jgi:Methyltransferase domain